MVGSVTLQITKGGPVTSGKLAEYVKKEGDRLVWNLTQMYAAELRKATVRFQYPRPMLKRRIRALKAGEGQGRVVMPEYGYYVNLGRRPGRGPPDTPEIKRWASMVGMTPAQLSKAIAKRGTRPTKFIDKGFEIARNRAKHIIRKGAKRMVKR